MVRQLQRAILVILVVVGVCLWMTEVVLFQQIGLYNAVIHNTDCTSWPTLGRVGMNTAQAHSALPEFNKIEPKTKTESESESASASEPHAIRLLVIADPHLIGHQRGHWLDRLRREFAMQQSFRAIAQLLPEDQRPHAVLLLGDIFDEGQWDTQENWDDDLRRFHRVFDMSSMRSPNRQPPLLKVVVGNHDVGFHYVMNQWLLERFAHAFGPATDSIMISSNSDRTTERQSIQLVTLNSIAMRQDGCTLCNATRSRISDIAQELTLQPDTTERPPVVLAMHFPLFRTSIADRIADRIADHIARGTKMERTADESNRQELPPTSVTCPVPQDRSGVLQLHRSGRVARRQVSSHEVVTLPDLLPLVNLSEEQLAEMRSGEDRETISEEGTKLLLESLAPRLVFSAHAHEDCVFTHSDGTIEVSVGSFNRRNDPDARFLLATVSTDASSPVVASVVFCHIPHEDVVYVMYAIAVACVALVALYSGVSFVWQTVQSRRRKRA
ncbi:metallophosphoesterase 1 [Capsaspora owczarzaki ATCC 30864]|uniref:Metallophosphoesterase 1 n=1 Tax=Capsaspora owczarzaki (strain ATCC 30864) TaxID=595528 RepID=A0A0D2X555_CAPO3|nr:metallophosphoesterase 1 [Capsaspora owczarzaki ATCC 30864]KJE97219.1 metallophosphoesterase 1 [Capsaspora owczarzaki ATCC 30864]|eukprot:XP_004343536.1 metallophosphoesterase 1 [Capsaspora owczarzaki ATCC 30864]